MSYDFSEHKRVVLEFYAELDASSKQTAADVLKRHVTQKYRWQIQTIQEKSCKVRILILKYHKSGFCLSLKSFFFL